jgi:hypothetical protein
MSDAILAAGSFLLGKTLSKDRASSGSASSFLNSLIFLR